MLLMGTRAAAVPAAAISVKVPISLYLICDRLLVRWVRIERMLWTHWSLLDLPSPALGNFADCVTRHGFDHVLTVGNDNRAAFFGVAVDSDEAGSGELVDFCSCSAVEVEGDAEAFFLGFPAVSQHRSVVAANLGTTCAFRSSAVEVFQDQACDWWTPW